MIWIISVEGGERLESVRWKCEEKRKKEKTFHTRPLLILPCQVGERLIKQAEQLRLNHQ